MNNRLYKHMITAGPIGYVPASGTIASALSFGLIMLMQWYTSSYLFYWIVFALCFLIGLYATYRSIDLFLAADPREIVYDEFIGCFIALGGCVCTWYGYMAAFFLFRLFDITKWFGIAALEKGLPRIAGIYADDIAAGILTHLILRWSGLC